MIDAMIIIAVLTVATIILAILAISGGGEPFAVIWLIGFFVLRNGWFILFDSLSPTSPGACASAQTVTLEVR